MTPPTTIEVKIIKAFAATNTSQPATANGQPIQRPTADTNEGAKKRIF